MSNEELNNAFENKWKSGYFEYIFACLFGKKFFFKFYEFTKYKGKIYYIGK